MIILDSLGLHVYRAYVSNFGHTYGQGGEWALQIPADYPTVRFGTPDAAKVWAAQSGWQVVAEIKDGYNLTVLHIEHTETRAAYEARQARQDHKWAVAKPCYVRYGTLPKDGRSRNHAEGVLEDGVSVFHGERLPTGEARALPKTDQCFTSMVSIMDRDLYIVTGREIGHGSDGEPVLDDCRIWRKAK